METKPDEKENEIKVILLDHWCSDRDIAEAAWASTGRDGENRPMEEVERVVTKQIIPFDHVTPLEAVWFKFYLHVPIFVERQLDKTRMSIQGQDYFIEFQNGDFGRLGITQNELSLRYRQMRNTYYPFPKDVVDILEKMDTSNEDAMGIDGQEIIRDYGRSLNEAMERYEYALKVMNEHVKAGRLDQGKMKRVREVLRGILGTSFYTDMQLTMNLNALKVMADKRLEKGHPQPETQWTVSLMVQQAIEKKVAPLALAGLIEKGNWEILTSAP